MTWQQWLAMATHRLTASSSSSAKLDAEILLEQTLKVTRAKVFSFGETVIKYSELSLLERCLERREQGIPIAYIIGEREFWSLRLRVSSDTFIPRPDTECLVQQALILLPNIYANVLDLGTGSGSIALAMAAERSNWLITGTDTSIRAIAIARRNAIRLRLNNVQFYKSDWFREVQQESLYHLIVSNPPYVSDNDPHLLQGDVRFEPRSALVSEENGLKDLKTICIEASQYLLPGGYLLLEHGYCQAELVRNLMRNAGFVHILTLYDYEGRERVSQGQKLK